MSPPLLYALVVPARQAYSHCASVGRSNPSIPVRARSFPMNESGSTAEDAGHFAPSPFPRIMSYDTLSTGRASPLNLDGFDPVTSSYCFCVTSKTPQ